MEFLCGLFISVYFSVFKFVDCVVVCSSSFVVCLLFLFLYFLVSVVLNGHDYIHNVYCPLLYCTVLYCTVLHCTTQ